jgi:hypothetical protein
LGVHSGDSDRTVGRVFGKVGKIRVYDAKLHSLVGWSPVITILLVLTSFLVSVISVLVASTGALDILKIVLSFTAVLFAVFSTERVTRIDSAVMSETTDSNSDPE